MRGWVSDLIRSIDRGIVMRFGSSQRWLVILGSLSLVPVIVVAALQVGVSTRGSIAALPATDVLDYLSRPGRLQPLSQRFIAKVLGGDIPASLEAGRSLPVLSRGSSSDVGRLTDIHPLTNDDLVQARAIPAVPFTAKTTTRQATREAADPSACGSAGGTVWYRYTPTQDLALIAYTFGSDHAISLGAFEGSPGDLRTLRCDTDTAANALVAFSAKAGRTYYFQIAAPLGGGDLVFSVDPHGAISRASVSSSGKQSNGNSSVSSASISPDGRYVAFVSSATNFVEGLSQEQCLAHDPTSAADEDPCTQIYMRDRVKGTTTLVSVSNSGEAGDSNSDNAAISVDGRYVVFESVAANLFAGDTTASWDLFVHDTVSRRTERIPAAPSAPYESIQFNVGGFFVPTISADGRYVAFQSPASGIVPEDTNGDWDAFVYDRATGSRERVSVSSSGRQSDSTQNFQRYWLSPSISADGRYVAFQSEDDLVDGDTNGVVDDFVHDRLTRTTERISVSSTGEQGNAASKRSQIPATRISADGRYVAFASSASNLVAQDTNEAIDVFVRDRVASRTVRVSISSSGAEAEGAQAGRVRALLFQVFSMSLDGRYVAFESFADNLAPGDQDGQPDVFLHDVLTQTTTLVTLSPTGEESLEEKFALMPSVSGDGRFVAFSSQASNLVEGDTNGVADVFVYEAVRRR